MARDLNAMLDALDLAIGSAAGLFGTDAIDPVAHRARDVRRRIGFLGETVVVALAGGTGSGKSSLLNALAGEPVAQAGVIRPTTSSALAWIPANPEPGLVRLLDDLEIFDRVGQTRFDHLAVIDLPDLDSFDRSNVAEVRRLVPRLDAVVWVFDPLKYNDRAVHHGFLRELTDYDRQFLYVLNQVDRLAPIDVQTVSGDLWKSLVNDGMDDPVVLTTAADPIYGDPVGIDEFEEALHDRFEQKQVAIAKLVADVKTSVVELETSTGVTAAGGLDFDARWNLVRESTVTHMTDRVADQAVATGLEDAGEAAAMAAGAGLVGRTTGLVRQSIFGRAVGLGVNDPELPEPTDITSGAGWLDTTAPLINFVTDLSVDAGGQFGGRLRERFGPDRLDIELRDSALAVQSAVGKPERPEPRSWWGGMRYIQFGLSAVVLIAILIAVFGFAGIEAGQWSAPLLIAAAAIMISLAVVQLLRSSGRAAGRAIADRYRDEVAASLETTIERKVGQPLRNAMQSRADLAGALADVRLALREHG